MRISLIFKFLIKFTGILSIPINSSNGKIPINFHMIPSCVIGVIYIVCLLSLFWKNENRIEVSITANHIQVNHNHIYY